MPQQAIEDDEAGVGGDLVGTGRASDEARSFGKINANVGDGFAILVHRGERRRQPKVVGENRFPLQAVGLIAEVW